MPPHCAACDDRRTVMVFTFSSNATAERARFTAKCRACMTNAKLPTGKCACSVRVISTAALGKNDTLRCGQCWKVVRKPVCVRRGQGGTYAAAKASVELGLSRCPSGVTKATKQTKPISAMVRRLQ